MRDHVLSQNYEQFLNYEKAKQSAVANPNFDTLPRTESQTTGKGTTISSMARKGYFSHV